MRFSGAGSPENCEKRKAKEVEMGSGGQQKGREGGKGSTFVKKYVKEEKSLLAGQKKDKLR